MRCEGLRVVVVGGGIGGLAAGLLLARSGAAVTILDRPTDADTRGAGLLVQPNGLAVLRALSLGGPLEAAGHRLDVTSLRGADGRQVSRLRMPDFGAGLDHVLCVRRRSLVGALGTAVAEEPLATVRSAEVMKATPDGTVVVADGAGPLAPEADLVVGADGVGSAVRASGTFGARARGTGRWYARGLVPVDVEDADAAAQVTGEHWTTSGVFGGAPVGDGLFYFYCSLDAPIIAEALAAGERAAFVRAWTSTLTATAPVLDGLGGLDSLLVNQAHEVVCDRWVDGRLVLLGDAAHAMEPTLGQGANSALVDAAVLCLEITRGGGLAAALRRYQQRRLHPVTGVQRSSERLARLAGLRHGLSRTSRDAVLRLLSRQALLTRQARAAQQEPPAALLGELSAQLGDGGGLPARDRRSPIS
ncbi:MAG TPA: NAD(P)/FAD-dependent oxidoreductase [Nocardioidaceae bacterium]|nr:NAD(P)/FAD-dependent oxidoreductase [Nocardioidaceae bacterium]